MHAQNVRSWEGRAVARRLGCRGGRWWEASSLGIFEASLSSPRALVCIATWTARSIVLGAHEHRVDVRDIQSVVSVAFEWDRGA